MDPSFGLRGLEGGGEISIIMKLHKTLMHRRGDCSCHLVNKLVELGFSTTLVEDPLVGSRV